MLLHKAHLQVKMRGEYFIHKCKHFLAFVNVKQHIARVSEDMM